jgi:RNA polymerase sigma-70 factor, ECF subfamily
VDRREPNDLLQRVAAGDHHAFDRFYDLMAPTVHGVVVSVVRDVHLAQDVTQEVLLDAWRTATRFDPNRGSARAWLTTMAHRRAVDRVRAVEASAAREALAGARNTTPDHDAVSDVVDVRLEQEAVRRCLHELTDLQRGAVTLAFYRGYTHREVSAVLDVPLGTVKARLRDALARLRDCLGV